MNLSKLFIAASILFSANFATATVPSFPTESGDLTAEQCVALNAKLDKYIAYINAWLAKQPKKWQKLLKPYVDYAISEAETYVDKVCPEAEQTTLVFECKVFGPSFETLTIGLDSGSNLVSTANPSPVVCSTENACLNIVALKFSVITAEQSSRCQPGNSSGIVRLTETEVQTKVNAIP